MTPQEEITSLEKQLAELYLSIADKYKRMSKVSDGYRLNVMQSGIDQDLGRAKVLRDRLDTLRKKVTDEWNNADKGVKL